MNEYGGIDMKVKKGWDGGVKKPSKSMPRSGAAKNPPNNHGQEGYMSGAVNKAVGMVKGYNCKPSYFAGAGMKVGRK